MGEQTVAALGGSGGAITPPEINGGVRSGAWPGATSLYILVALYDLTSCALGARQQDNNKTSCAIGEDNGALFRFHILSWDLLSFGLHTSLPHWNIPDGTAIPRELSKFAGLDTISTASTWQMSPLTIQNVSATPTLAPTLADTKMVDKKEKPQNYKGFVAGVFSGVAKLSVGHPFDTIKVRLQTSDKARFSGPLQCLLMTVRKEGISGLYKGATPPLVGWMFMDSIMLGSLTFYRKFLGRTLFAPSQVSTAPFGTDRTPSVPYKLPTIGHGMAGVMAGVTVSFVAAPVEHIKARLQIQYSSQKSSRLYQGPIDCFRKIYRYHGIPGVYHGLSATLLFRSFFFFWWGSYDVFTRFLSTHTQLSTPAINFWAGGLSAQVFWITSYPSDVVKQRIMTDSLGGGLNDGVRRFPNWKSAARTVYRENGVRGYWRGFLPCFLRAFPANAVALVAFEGVLRWLP